uniref:glycerophosphodiester phosphodiesterase family protein n=1 Tax=uncultured Altererythrobacter sp. TaxID=500840 RepID=UPI002619B05F|nr:glycerophosphodiester phosphodiesterase family protein [uncultured Altererythrobacter sp.]
MTRRARPDWLTRWEYAHRGLHGNGVPENSLKGAQLAIDAGLGVECDIQRSADDWPMVFHDWALDRLTEAGGQTEARTKDELQQLCYRGSEERIATLPDLLELVDGRVPLLIEIKSKPGYDVEWTCLYIDNYLRAYTGNCAVMSFDPRVVRWFRKHSPQTCVGLVMREDEHGYTQKAWQRRMAYWIALPDFLAYHIEALPNDWVARLRRKGLPVLTWTANSPEMRRRALSRADALISEGEGLA